LRVELFHSSLERRERWVTFAKAEHPVAMPDAGRDDAIVVSLLRDGAVFLGRDRVIPPNSAAASATSWPIKPTRPFTSRRMRGQITGTLKTSSTPSAVLVQKNSDC
jgi:hypothetical protein